MVSWVQANISLVNRLKDTLLAESEIPDSEIKNSRFLGSHVLWDLLRGSHDTNALSKLHSREDAHIMHACLLFRQGWSFGCSSMSRPLATVGGALLSPKHQNNYSLVQRLSLPHPWCLPSCQAPLEICLHRDHRWSSYYNDFPESVPSSNFAGNISFHFDGK